MNENIIGLRTPDVVVTCKEFRSALPNDKSLKYPQGFLDRDFRPDNDGYIVSIGGDIENPNSILIPIWFTKVYNYSAVKFCLIFNNECWGGRFSTDALIRADKDIKLLVYKKSKYRIPFKRTAQQESMDQIHGAVNIIDLIYRKLN